MSGPLLDIANNAGEVLSGEFLCRGGPDRTRSVEHRDCDTQCSGLCNTQRYIRLNDGRMRAKTLKICPMHVSNFSVRARLLPVLADRTSSIA